MYCPKCKSEYIDGGSSKCIKCGSELAEFLDESAEPRENAEYVTLVETGDKAQLAVVKSILEGSGIPFVVFGEELQDIIALGGIGYNPIIGAMKILVPQKDAADAAKLLEALDSDELPEECESSTETEISEEDI